MKPEQTYIESYVAKLTKSAESEIVTSWDSFYLSKLQPAQKRLKFRKLLKRSFIAAGVVAVFLGFMFSDMRKPLPEIQRISNSISHVHLVKEAKNTNSAQQSEKTDNAATRLSELKPIIIRKKVYVQKKIYLTDTVTIKDTTFLPAPK